jgi:hypothetical protein
MYEIYRTIYKEIFGEKYNSQAGDRTKDSDIMTYKVAGYTTFDHNSFLVGYAFLSLFVNCLATFSIGS